MKNKINVKRSDGGGEARQAKRNEILILILTMITWYLGKMCWTKCNCILINVEAYISKKRVPIKCKT